ncbi:folD [Symbiodinium sp. KB8]|nr:folD [Symbiodinium sp. KB8]
MHGLSNQRNLACGHRSQPCDREKKHKSLQPLAHRLVRVERKPLCPPNGRPSQYWFSGPSLASPRWNCSAACLGDGRILVVGGFDEFGLAVDTTEVVDIVTGEVSFGPRLTMPRAGCAAVALPLPIQEEEPELEGEDGEEEEEVWMPWVMVIGGYGADAGQSTEVLSVQAGTARPGPKLRSRRACCAAAMPRSRKFG